MSPPSFEPIREKMLSASLPPSAISSFSNTFTSLTSGSTGQIPESSITPVLSLLDLDTDIIPTLKSNQGDGNVDGVDNKLLSETVVLKLNGGLGTGMGLDKAKSLLTVKSTDTFLDLAAKQIMGLRERTGEKVRFMLMNSFSTSSDTMEFMRRKYPELAGEDGVEMMQNKVPKLDAATFLPATSESCEENDWCPPGHGDLYAALVGSGTLDRLLTQGIKYMAVSNSDNLGATLDLGLLTYFAQSGKGFLMECCKRTEADKKGGHLATRISDGKLVLRESAMCAKQDEGDFQNVTKHRYFNTNNLWINLASLKLIVDKHEGYLPLPMIVNNKTVDPKNPNSQAVVQLETAMGAAIEMFDDAIAITVSRLRFAPVKKCDDLLLLRSDAYILDSEYRPVLNPKCNGIAPIITLDSKKYKFVQQLEAATKNGVPSLVNCCRLTIEGQVHMCRANVFKGQVTLKNRKDEPKLLPKRTFENTSVDLTAAPGLGPLLPHAIATSPIEGQAPGTSGLRKKTKVFQQANYLENFVQATLTAVMESGTDISSGTLLLGGDGRFFNSDAIQVILKIALANGVSRVWVGQNGLLSTPAVSAIIRERGPGWQRPFGAFILTASHNPGGAEEDFGIKYNCENGGPAQEALTDSIYGHTKAITSYNSCSAFPRIDITKIGQQTVSSMCGGCEVNIEVISSTSTHLLLLATIFDFPAIRSLLRRADFSMVYDTMHGVNGPYARALFVEEFGLPLECMVNSVPKEDFNGTHADPNLTYAVDLVKIMGLDKRGLAIETGEPVPSFGAAADGDGDRNMILGSHFFVTPSDSLAILAAHSSKIPFFSSAGGLKAVARSMPTSTAIDKVAEKLNIKMFEVPTGWKFFCNIMDSKCVFGKEDHTPFMCGEESFGTGSDHIREKDGLWAVLAWLNVLACSQKEGRKLVGVQDIVEAHWKTYGRNHYQRYDFEGVDKACATNMMNTMSANKHSYADKVVGQYTIGSMDMFEYHDPIDHSVSKNQGIRILLSDGSRVIFRLSGTAGSGATVRMYVEKYCGCEDGEGIQMETSKAVEGLVELGLGVCDIKGFCGTGVPTVIT